TTGEGVSLTSSERRQLAEEWKKVLPPGLKLIVHVGHQSLAESCALAQHAQRVGVDAIAAIAPSFFKPGGVDDLVHWAERVAAAAPKLPFYYYHMPSMTGVRISAAQFLSRASESVPNLAGVKFTDEDIEDFKAALLIAGERYDVLFGRDELLLTGLENGATGAVGSTYNYAAPLYLEIMRASKAGERAKAEKNQAFARAFIDVMVKHGGLPAGKAIMQLIGLDCGPVRPPLRSLSRTEVAALRADLDSLGFFSCASTL
ncbi:MAG: dihydrodipicolinate synthetase, partial [Dechloromonas sp.]